MCKRRHMMKMTKKKPIILILLLLVGIGLTIIYVKETYLRQREYVVEFEEAPIYVSDLDDNSTLSDKLSKGINYALLLDDMESVKDVHLSSIKAVLFDICDKPEKYRSNTVYYFDHQALYNAVANKFGISVEELIEMNNLPELENNIVEHTLDGDDFRGYVEVTDVEWIDEAKAEVSYKLYANSDYFLWDGKVVLQEKDGNMIFVSNVTP